MCSSTSHFRIYYYNKYVCLLHFQSSFILNVTYNCIHSYSHVFLHLLFHNYLINCQICLELYYYPCLDLYYYLCLGLCYYLCSPIFYLYHSHNNSSFAQHWKYNHYSNHFEMNSLPLVH